jgi:hypothetical protein
MMHGVCHLHAALHQRQILYLLLHQLAPQELLLLRLQLLEQLPHAHTTHGVEAHLDAHDAQLVLGIVIPLPLDIFSPLHN